MTYLNGIEIELYLDAAPEVVFAAWTSESDLEEWIADRATADAKEGGVFRLETDGDEDIPGVHVCSGIYKELIKPSSIVKTWLYESADPHENLETVVTVRLEPDGDGTLMTFREEGEGLESEEDRVFTIDAWNGAFEALRALVEE